MAKYLLKAGSHSGKGDSDVSKTFRKGDVIDSQHDLVKMFGRDKFELLVEAPESAAAKSDEPVARVKAKVSPAKPPVAQEPDKAESESANSTAAQEEEAKDVSAEFPDAEKASLKVLKSGDVFGVFDEDNLKKPIKTYKTVDGVNGFIKKYMEDNE